MPHRLLRLAWALTGVFWVSSSFALVVDIANFGVVRNGAAIFVDPFDDGLPPPNAPDFASGATASYAVVGSFPAGSESAGRLTIDTDNGVVHANAGGAARQTTSALLQTPANSSGLGIDDMLRLRGLFDLSTPVGPRYNGYGIEFSDAAGGVQHQAAQLQVRFNEVTQVTEIDYHLQDYDSASIIDLGHTAFAPPAGADQILLQIARPDTGNLEFLASYFYLDSGNVVGSGSFATPASLFDGEDYVHAYFFASAAVVPEPQTVALFAAGLGVLAGVRLRRR